MKYRFGIVSATVVSAIALWSIWIIEAGTETAADHSALAQLERTDGDGAPITIGTSAAEMDVENGDRGVEAAIGNGSGAVEDSFVFARASPAEIENAIYQRIAEQPDLKLTSLSSVECDTSRCRIVFTGVDANPQYVGEYGELYSALRNPPWDAYRPTSGGMGTREVSPGAREYVLEFTYVALVDSSDDPEVAARQNAACAGAWARVTQLRGSNEYIRMAGDKTAEYLALAAGTLGLEEARRFADELQFGPLTHECHAFPY
jgi:hypothetical protein